MVIRRFFQLADFNTDAASSWTSISLTNPFLKGFPFLSSTFVSQQPGFSVGTLLVTVVWPPLGNPCLIF